MKQKIYLDYNATTPCDTVVSEAIIPYLNEDFGNPSSIHHSFGWIAKEAVEVSTQTIAKTLDIDSETILYTSGATEAINMVLKSFSQKYQPGGSHIITCKTEHKAVLDTCEFMEQFEGVSVTYLEVDTSGLVNLEALEAALRPETILVAIMFANNETGVIQPLKDIAKIIANRDIYFFTDATQALGKTNLNDVFETVDFACFSAHKVYGPKGIGMVYSRDVPTSSLLRSFVQGGGQQKGWRGGTLNTPGIVGFAKAVELCYENLDQEMSRLTRLRDLLEAGLLKIDMSYSNGHPKLRLPNTLNISFAYVNGADLLRALSKDMAVSNGSACNSVSKNPSHVLQAMGIDSDLAFSSIRFSLGKYTTAAEINKAIDIIQKQVCILRESNILWERRNT